MRVDANGMHLTVYTREDELGEGSVGKGEFHLSDFAFLLNMGKFSEPALW